ncbi:MAG: response regulator transcription factor [Chloroflexi bacterium]|nr:response regulator transcription factor [Chloroflexota bacterium]MBI3732526.1 response regulator transcription factor [Chloroflexota bacterium]
MSLSQKLRLLVVDDEPTILEFLKTGLGYEGYEVMCCADGLEALRLAHEHKPDLIILDVMLPRLDGFAVCKRLRAASDVPIIMLTARDEVPERVTGLELGADDYLTKPFAFIELLARMRAVLRRRGLSAESQALRFADISLNRETREVRRGERAVNLTPREFELLELFMSHPRQVFGREVILNRVWGHDYDGDTNVVEVHIGHLREKLSDRPPRLLQTVHGVGYVLRED